MLHQDCLTEDTAMNKRSVPWITSSSNCLDVQSVHVPGAQARAQVKHCLPATTNWASCPSDDVRLDHVVHTAHGKHVTACPLPS